MTAKLTVDDKSLDLDIVEGTEQERGLDIGKLRAETGIVALDPGFVNTGSCQSAITFIDGPQGVLLHRGYSIEDLAAHSTYLELCFLLLNGNLPDGDQMASFERAVKGQWMLHEKLKNFFLG